MSNHLQRLLVAIIAIPLIIGVTIAGGIWFFVFIGLIATIGLTEFYALSSAKEAKPLTIAGAIIGFFILHSFYNSNLLIGFHSLLGQASNSEAQFLLFVLLVSIPLISLTELFRNNGSAQLNLSTTLMGLFYVSLFFGTLIGIRELFSPFHVPVTKYFPTGMSPDIGDILYRWGGYTVVTIYAMIWICDSAAYYVGRAIGKHKLFPRVSPNKSWEGAIAGFIFAVLTAIGAKFLFLHFLHLHEAIILGIIVGLFGQLGDLFESLLKRDAGVKDSSHLIPGHGGVLDRFDSLLFVAPIVYLYLDFIVFSFN